MTVVDNNYIKKQYLVPVYYNLYELTTILVLRNGLVVINTDVKHLTCYRLKVLRRLI